MKTKYENSLITLERNIQTLMLNQEALELKRNAIKLKEKEMSDCENELNHLKMQSKKQKDNLTEKLRLLSALQEQVRILSLKRIKIMLKKIIFSIFIKMSTLSKNNFLIIFKIFF